MRIYHRDALTGGMNALDGIDGASLSDGDRAFVMEADTFYAYRLVDAYAPEASDPPAVIAPVANAGTKRWIRQATS